MPLYNRLIEKGKEEDKNPGTALNKLKEVGSTAASLVGIDPESDTLVQDLGYEMLDMAAHQRGNPGIGGAISYVGSQAVQNIPLIKKGKKYISSKIDDWLTNKKFSRTNPEVNSNRYLEGQLEVSLTGPKDLNLYGASPDQFEVINNMNTALAEEVPRGGRRVKFGNYYYTIHRKKGETVMTPYNKWYQRNIDPFKIPKDLEAKWRAQEPQQLDITETGGKKVKQQYGTKGKTREVPQTIRYPSGTVDEFKAWYKNVFDLQQEERALMQQLSTIAEKADLVEARPKGKKFFEMDKSHIVPRSRGGSGLTFLEAWLANQKRGNDWILNPDALDRAGIPKNWDDLFNQWYAAKKGGKELQTGLGPLDNINVDDYFSIEDGQDLSIVARRRQNIRNLVNRQIGNPDTALIKGDTGTIADDYRNLVLESKGYDKFDDPKLHNPKILDIGYTAENYEDLIELGEL